MWIDGPPEEEVWLPPDQICEHLEPVIRWLESEHDLHVAVSVTVPLARSRRGRRVISGRPARH